MFGCASNSINGNASVSSFIISRSRNALGNRSDIGLKHEIDINGNGRK